MLCDAQPDRTLSGHSAPSEPMSRVAILAAACAFLMASLAGCGTAVERPPNFIVVFIDDLGYGDIGPFGSETNRTPHLDRMAAEGMKLTSFYVAAPVCTPSRAALLTGSYPRRVGLATGPRMGVLYPGDEWGLHEDEVTIAEVLQEQGYATGCFGKWHLGDQPEFLPTQHGFETYVGIPYSNDMWPFHIRAQQGGIYNFPPLPLMRDSEVIGEVSDMRAQADLCKLFTDEAVDFIRKHQAEPFFVYLPHAFIHHPRAARESFMESAGEDRESIDWTAITASSPWHCDSNGDCSPGSASADAWSDLTVSRTRAQIEEVDWSVGTILDIVRELGLAEETLVVFTSDNGGSRGSVNDPLRGRKGTTWEGGMREPTVVWWPGSVPGGSVSDEIVTSMDLLPTFAVLSGGEIPQDRILDGRDVSDILLGRPGAKSPHDAFYYYWQHDLRAVRSGPWKLIRESGELFNLEEDVGETWDVAKDNPEVVARLKELLEVAAADLGVDKEACPNCRPVGSVEEPQTLLPRLSRD